MVTSALEKRRNALGFRKIGMGGGKELYLLEERANASKSADLVAKSKLSLATYQVLLRALSSVSSLKARFNDNGKSKFSFWIAGSGRVMNQLVADSQPEVSHAQQSEIIRLAESGMNQADIAAKLGVTAAGVHYALKGSKGRRKTSKKPRTTALCTFDKHGNLVVGAGASIETTVRISRGPEDGPLLFFVLRDSYARIGGARFVIAGCNGRQFTPDTLARVVVGIPQETRTSRGRRGA